MCIDHSSYDHKLRRILKPVSRNAAELMTYYWRRLAKERKLFLAGEHLNKHILRGFFIPYEDLVAIREVHKHQELTGVRAYICLEGIKAEFLELKLVVVPVDKDGKDILQLDPAQEDSPSTIYDFTRPCPTQCDEESALYKEH